MQKKIWMAVILSGFAASGCASNRVQEKSDAASAFKVGKTTRQEVDQVLGSPKQEARNLDGTTSVFYQVDNETAPLFGSKGSTLIGIVGSVLPMGGFASSAVSTASQVQGTAAVASYGAGAAAGTNGKMMVCQFTFDKASLLVEGGSCTNIQ